MALDLLRPWASTHQQALVASTLESYLSVSGPLDHLYLHAPATLAHTHPPCLHTDFPSCFFPQIYEGMINKVCIVKMYNMVILIC